MHNDGSASISITSGGNSNYTYEWFNSQNISISQTNNTAINLSEGIYSCIITDTNGCSSSATVNLIDGDSISSIISQTTPTCYDACDGSISVINTNGGTPPYTYTLNNDTINDPTNITGLCSGLYNILITDSNNCSSINSIIVDDVDPILINIWIDSTNLMATNGFVLYQWYDGFGIPISGATSEIFSPTSMGEYYVVVTDANGCSESSFIIYYNINGLNNQDQIIKMEMI